LTKAGFVVSINVSVFRKSLKFSGTYLITIQVVLYSFKTTTLNSNIFVFNLAVEPDILEEIMYAIIRTGGKQYQVAAGERLRVEKLNGEVGDSVELSDVLMIADGENVRIGQPVIDGAKVTAQIIEQGKEKKVIIFKKKRRKGYRLKKGHRQLFTALEIKEISA